MAFKPPSAILQRVLRFKALEHKSEGRLTLWGIPAILYPNYSIVYLQRLMEKEFGQKKAASIMYSLGNFQSKQTFKMISERFGYAKSIQNKSDLLKFNSGQSEIAGHGTGEWIRMDFQSNTFIVRGKPTFSEEYKRFFGIQKGPVDHFMRGSLAAFVESVTEKPMFCIETFCMSNGKSYCEFLIKERNAFSKKEIAGQEVEEMPCDVKALGAKIEPYLALLG